MKNRSSTAAPKEKVSNPEAIFDNPSEVVQDEKLAGHEKSAALDTWEQDARQLMTASNEGMPAPREGVDPADHHELGKVVRAKSKIGEKPRHKLSH